jgi:long-chain acyl-CoA synthetase
MTVRRKLLRLEELLEQAAIQHGNRPAVDFMGRRWTYSALLELVDRFATGLQKSGVKLGDRVALCLPNTPYYVIGYFAILKVGGVVVPINPLYSEREIAHLINDSGARIALAPDIRDIAHKLALVGTLERIVICSMADILPRFKALAYRIVRRQSTIGLPFADQRMVQFGDMLSQRDTTLLAADDQEKTAVLQYTGGTTGLPKGATLTHANLLANCLQMARHDHAAPTSAESAMAVLPFFHVFALTTILNYSVLTAACMVLLPRFEMKAFLAAFRRTRPERLFVVPTILSAINELPDKALPPTTQLRLCVSGGAPLPSEVRRNFERRTGARVLEGYGLSEASPIITCNPTVGEVRDGSAGVAFPDTAIEILSLDTGKPVSSGEIGEVCVRGPQIMAGYWNRPDETAEVLRDGKLRTGDVGYIDGDGFLFLVDRIKDLILCGGYNVYPRVIEDALYEHPGVLEANVVGVPDRYRGETPKAFIKLRAGVELSDAEIRHFLSDRISKIEMPSQIEFRDELPRTMIGKLSKKELRSEDSS